MSSENEDLALSATLGAPDPALEATIAHDGATLTAGGVNVTLPMTTTTNVNTSLRTTVLPRVEIIGEQSKIVADGKVRYELSRRLGEGGVGEVLMARDNDIDRDVAIKRLRSELQSSHATVLRFAEEVRTVGRLEHPNIVPIHDVGVHPNGEYFFVMKYVHGETLESIIDKLAAGDPEYHKKYDIERRVEIMMGILEAIAYAHSKNILHRDIKPGNVMVGPYGEVMMMDWGLAREIQGPETVVASDALVPTAAPSGKRLYQTQVGALLGTPAYMSPEQARGEQLDERSDTFSLCMMFYELLSLRHPYADRQTLEEMLEAVKNAPTPRSLTQKTGVQPPVPADLDWFLAKGLEKDKAKRFQSVDEMITRLRRRAAGDIPIQCPFTFTMRMSTLLRQAVARRPFLMSSVFVFGGIGMFVLASMGAMHLIMR